MTKQELLIEAECNYYLTIGDSEEVFNLLEDKSKKLVLDSKIEDGILLDIHEFKFYISSCTKMDLETYYYYLINNGELLLDEYFTYLKEEEVYLWYNVLKESCMKEGPEEIKEWETIFQKNFNKYKASMRDKKINQILND
jgi:hypothetical protein